MALCPTPSQQNAQDLREFVSTLHTDVYPAIELSSNRLPQPFTTVILGGSGAVGGGLARSYARAGTTGLVLAARRLQAIEKVAQEAMSINPSIQILTIQCDISSPSDVLAVATAANAQFGNTIGAVIVNAGYTGAFVNNITQENFEDLQIAFNVNTLGTANAARYFIPLLVESVHKKRLFLVISSMSAATINGPIAHINYCASKFAQVRIIEMIKEQYEQEGLFVASVHPGGVKSDFSMNMPQQYKHCKTAYFDS